MLVFDNVTKQFTEDSYGVKDISFSVDAGDFLFVTGHSGSGKTTLMRLITKEYTPTEGEIFFEDYSVNQLKNSQLHEHRRKIGVVFQNYRLLHELNVWENIALPLMITGKKSDEIEERVTDLLKLVELTDKAQLFPTQLSGGEAQRISIARALATGPSIIFADEPTGNLDKDTSLKIARLLHKINELGTTVIFATHDNEIMSELAGMRTIFLEKGQIVKDVGGKKQVKKVVETAKADRTEAESAGAKADDEAKTETESETNAETENQAAENIWGETFKSPDLVLKKKEPEKPKKSKATKEKKLNKEEKEN